MIVTELSSFVAGLICLACGALLSLFIARWRVITGWITFIATSVAAFLASINAVSVILAGQSRTVTLAALPTYGSVLRMQIDGLSAFFVLLIAFVSTLAALYSIRYMSHYRDYGVARYYPSFLLFVAGMYAIVTITDLMLVFCGIWQVMTVASFLLVRFEYRRSENVRAAWRYLILMEIACAFVMGGAYTLARHVSQSSAASRFDFETLMDAMGHVHAESPIVVVALVLFLIGFGIKAGMWPFGQLWLPDAHPAAPSPVSALLSGVMIKTGIYGLMRSFLWLMPADASFAPTRLRWGAAIAVIGTLTLFIGTMQALKQERTKRLLAFSSIGQIGYILLGLGACLALTGPASAESGWRTLALASLLGALMHTLNHATFKSLLFLNAGSVLYASETQDLNRLGGLMRFMPLTAATALVASLSIAGVPGFNGFTSKWSIYVATILGARGVALLPFLGLIAILTSAVTLAAILKFFGMIFLARRSALVSRLAVHGPLEPPITMRIPQIVLAVSCLAVGIAPAWAYAYTGTAFRTGAQGISAALSEPLQAGGVVGVGIGGQALLNPLIFALVLCGLIWLARFIARLGGAERRTSEAWLCGYAPEHESNRYRAHGLYGEIKRYFGWIGGGPRKSDG